jgi:hypothetical protein
MTTGPPHLELIRIIDDFIYSSFLLLRFLESIAFER